MRNAGPSRAQVRPRGNSGSVLFEASVVIVAGLVFGLLANFISPRGIALGRDYFPKPPAPVAVPAITNAQPSPAPMETNVILARLRSRGLQPADHATVAALFQDPRRARELFIFVDARKAALFEAGHIPGAFSLDYYHPESGLSEALSAAATAEKIVVYCAGGDCEDSELTAVLLEQAGVPRERLLIYIGGHSEWLANDMPVELGARMSGVLKGGGQ